MWGDIEGHIERYDEATMGVEVYPDVVDRGRETGMLYLQIRTPLTN